MKPAAPWRRCAICVYRNGSFGRQDAILAASQMLQSWVSVALVAGVIVAAFIGAMIGKRIVKKHLAA